MILYFFRLTYFFEMLRAQLMKRRAVGWYGGEILKDDGQQRRELMRRQSSAGCRDVEALKERERFGRRRGSHSMRELNVDAKQRVRL